MTNAHDSGRLNLPFGKTPSRPACWKIGADFAVLAVQIPPNTTGRSALSRS